MRKWESQGNDTQKSRDFHFFREKAEVDILYKIKYNPRVLKKEQKKCVERVWRDIMNNTVFPMGPMGFITPFTAKKVNELLTPVSSGDKKNKKESK